MRLPTLLEAGLVALLLIALAVLAWNFDPFGRLKRAKAGQALATQQATNNAEAVRQVDRYHTQTVVIREKEEGAVHAVQAAPGADTPLDADRRAALCAGLSRMRDGAEVCVDNGPSDVPGGLPGPEEPDAHPR